ncbi:MAG: glucuronate isomerase [Oscillospiraceae bacterium]|jgi:glucuronate isomerase|nr:glucuronate isomerase [Oscillospiraceae bacterium]MCI9580461.1 glucuronate isomerase [Oscillospiraceae bacterium]
MKEFMDQDFLLETPTAQKLYHGYAEKQPIIDYHCHVDPKEIFENRRFENIYQTWLEGDHYKWRVMRSNGVEERYITGDASEREKFQKFAEALPKAIGNPMYHWCHLELRTYFGYQGVLNGETAQEVWDLSEKKLKEDGMDVRGIIRQSNVAMIGTTDDPTSTLEWHKRLKEDASFQATVAPSFRPDKALNIEKPGWKAFLQELGASAGVEITSLETLEQALKNRMDAFTQAGCRAADHGLDYVPYREASRQDVDAILQKGLTDEAVTLEETEQFKTALLVFCAEQYAKMGWVMQIHYNCMRNPNSAMFAKLGPDCGFDCMNNVNCGGALYALLDRLYRTNSLPKTILYSLNPGENEMLDTMIGAFQGTEAAGKLQHGSAWWFNDNKTGMQDQLISLANLSLLGNFIGMLTDSRSFLSYTRHAYFRRILCNLVGGWIENGEYPADMAAAGALIEDICYHNAKRYFGL